MHARSAILPGLLVLCLLGAAAFGKAQQGGQAQAEEYIRSSENQWAEAEVSQDSGVAERILADDFVGIAPDGSHYSKAEEIARSKGAAPQFVSNKVSEIAVRFYGDAAVAQGREKWVKRNGQKGSYVWTDTWIRRNAKWQIVAAEDIELLETK